MEKIKAMNDNFDASNKFKGYFTLFLERMNTDLSEENLVENKFMTLIQDHLTYYDGNDL